jgi:hypothetical protein
MPFATPAAFLTVNRTGAPVRFTSMSISPELLLPSLEFELVHWLVPPQIAPPLGAKKNPSAYHPVAKVARFAALPSPELPPSAIYNASVPAATAPVTVLILPT